MTTNALTIDLSYFLHHLLIMYMYSFNRFPFPIISSHPNLFFFSFSKKLKQCLVENKAQLQKLFLATQPDTGFIFYFSQRYSLISLLIMKIYALHPPGNIRRTWNWFEAGPNEHNQLYHTSNYISSTCIFNTLKYIICNQQPK